MSLMQFFTPPKKKLLSFDPPSIQGQSSKRPSHNDSCKVLSLYILKPNPCHIYFLNMTLEQTHFEDPYAIASSLLPYFSHFPITFRKTRYYYELILEDTALVFLHINFME